MHTPTRLKTYTLEVKTDSFEDNTIEVYKDLNAHGHFTQIANNGPSTVQVEVNGLDYSHFTLNPGDVQVFSAGDLAVSKLAFTGSTATVQVMVSA